MVGVGKIMVNFVCIPLFLILSLVCASGQVIFDAHHHSHNQRVANRKVERRSTEVLVKNTPEWKSNNPPKNAAPQGQSFTSFLQVRHFDCLINTCSIYSASYKFITKTSSKEATAKETSSN